MLLLSLICLDRAFFLLVMSCSGKHVLQIANECLGSKAHRHLKLHALTLMCTFRDENALLAGSQFLLEEGEHFGADQLAGLRVAIEDAVAPLNSFCETTD